MSIVALYLVFTMLAVLWLDVTRYTIPNWLVFSLLGAYPLAVWLSPAPVDWPMALAGMLIVFAAGYGVFAMNWMGGGDVKLITACALWVGWQHLLDFIFLFALLGGALSVVVLALRQALPYLMAGLNVSRPLPRLLRHKEPVPYGVAIAVAFLILLTRGDIPAVSL